MKKIILITAMLFCLLQAWSASALMVYINEDQWKDRGDFIIYNNTSQEIEFSSDGWTHPDILTGGNIPPYSVRVDSDCDLTTGSNGGTLYVSPTGAGINWVKIWAHTEKGDQTYWTGSSVTSPGSSGGAPLTAESAPGDIITCLPHANIDDNDSGVYAFWMIGGMIVATFMVNNNLDSTGNDSTGGTKIILTFTDITGVNWNNFCVQDAYPWVP